MDTLFQCAFQQFSFSLSLNWYWETWTLKILPQELSIFTQLMLLRRWRRQLLMSLSGMMKKCFPLRKCLQLNHHIFSVEHFLSCWSILLYLPPFLTSGSAVQSLRFSSSTSLTKYLILNNDSEMWRIPSFASCSPQLKPSQIWNSWNWRCIIIYAIFSIDIQIATCCYQYYFYAHIYCSTTSQCSYIFYCKLFLLNVVSVNLQNTKFWWW